MLLLKFIVYQIEKHAIILFLFGESRLRLRQFQVSRLSDQWLHIPGCGQLYFVKVSYFHIFVLLLLLLFSDKSVNKQSQS